MDQVQKKKKIGILTSGGDAPGMNTAIRAVVRTAVYHNYKVMGIMRGFDGLLGAEIIDMNAKSVSDIINKGGTVLLTARCPEMLTSEGQDKAAQVCKVLGFDTLIVIGGDGSIRGGYELSKRGVNVIGIPGTIDLDVPFTEYTIGFDTAVNTGMKAINKIRDTSSSHERCSVVEVMGRNCGEIALWCAMAGGAEEVLVPENPIDTQAVIEQIIKNRGRGKTHNLIVVAEGVGGSVKLAREIEKTTGIETRATILGHLQRGGSPTAVDRIHASMMGYLAVESIIQQEYNKVMIIKNGTYDSVSLEEMVNSKRTYNNKMHDIVRVLSI